MRLQQHARTLLMASTLALALASVPIAGRAVHAQDNDHPTDNGVRCAIHNPRNGEWDFYLPGESITLLDGLGYPYTLVCGSDGHWVVQSREAPPSGTLALLPTSPLPARLAGAP